MYYTSLCLLGVGTGLCKYSAAEPKGNSSGFPPVGSGVTPEGNIKSQGGKKCHTNYMSWNVTYISYICTVYISLSFESKNS